MKSTIGETTGGIEDVDSDSFHALVLQGAGPIVVEFMSYGCAHCRVLEPIIENVARTLHPSERFFRVNVAIDHELANRYAIVGTPTLVFFRNGEELGRVEGPRPVTETIVRAVTQPFS